MSPYGSNPSYVDLMQRTFTGADEKAVLLSFSYDFSRLGASGLSAIVNYVEAWWTAPNRMSAPVPVLRDR